MHATRATKVSASGKSVISPQEHRAEPTARFSFERDVRPSEDDQLKQRPGASNPKRTAWPALKSMSGYVWWQVLLATSLAVLPYTLLVALRITTYNPTLELMVRRESLATSLAAVVDMSSVGHQADVEHLLPQPSVDCVTTDIFGRHSISPACTQDLRYQGLAPNHMIVALPGSGRFPRLASTHVLKADGRRVEFNETKLIDGVYAITFDPHEAFGTVTVSMTTRSPPLDIKATHNYGSRILQRKTYENAGTDVSKAVGKEVAVMRDAAKSLTDMLSTELRIGYRATKSVTTDLALAVSHDLQVFASNAISALDKVAKAGNGTATALSKDLILLQHDVVKFTKELSTTVTSAFTHARNETKLALRSPLALSRGRLLDLGHAVSRFSSKHRPFGKKPATTPPRRSSTDVVARSQIGRTYDLVGVPDAKAIAAAEAPDVVTHASRHVQRQVQRAMQQLERVTRHIKRKEHELQERGDRTIRKELRKLKKELKQREKAVAKLVDELKQRGDA